MISLWTTGLGVQTLVHTRLTAMNTQISPECVYGRKHLDLDRRGVKSFRFRAKCAAADLSTMSAACAAPRGEHVTFQE